MARQARIFVAGHRGLVGFVVAHALSRRGYHNMHCTRLHALGRRSGFHCVEVSGRPTHGSAETPVGSGAPAASAWCPSVEVNPANHLRVSHLAKWPAVSRRCLRASLAISSRTWRRDGRSCVVAAGITSAGAKSHCVSR